MHRLVPRTTLALGLIIGAGLATAAPASASAQPTQIQLSIVPHSGGPGRTVTLTCDPAGGTHPSAKQACADLALAGGDIRRIPPRPHSLCTGLWLPVTAKASGFWHGLWVSYSQVETNDGCARISRGDVFFF